MEQATELQLVSLKVVDITQEQMASLCGNVLELEDGRGLPVLALSTRVSLHITSGAPLKGMSITSNVRPCLHDEEPLLRKTVRVQLCSATFEKYSALVLSLCCWPPVWLRAYQETEFRVEVKCFEQQAPQCCPACVQAYNAFTADQRKVLRRHLAELHHAPIDTLEHVGGGGVRCALGEIFN